jgi:hypothetical protein
MAHPQAHWGKPHPLKWFRHWEDRILLENWIPIRFQPILFTFLFLGILFVLSHRRTLPAMQSVSGPVTAYTWLVLAVICPPLLFVAWVMIHYGTGRNTYRGYYLRFAADLGQTFSFSAWLLMLMSDPTPEPEDAYAIIIISSILAFLAVLVLRDILKLVLLERAGSAVQEVADVKEAKEIQDVKDIIATAGKNTQRISDLEKSAGIRKTRADDAEIRESEWSLHRDHKEQHDG